MDYCICMVYCRWSINQYHCVFVSIRKFSSLLLMERIIFHSQRCNFIDIGQNLDGGDEQFGRRKDGISAKQTKFEFLAKCQQKMYRFQNNRFNKYFPHSFGTVFEKAMVLFGSAINPK